MTSLNAIIPSMLQPNESQSGRRLLIFTKAPVAGEVKTRLSPPLSPHQCAQLHSILIKHTLTIAQNSGIADIKLYCSPNCNHPELIELAKQYGVDLQSQQGADLGKRMYHAIRQNLEEKNTIVLIGTDCPVMQAAYIQKAFKLLEDGEDIVLGPAEDGGYVLIAARKIRQTLFQNINWGSKHVLQQTQIRLKTSTLKWRLLETLWDIDYPDDLIRLHKLMPEFIPFTHIKR